jgi:hypothetical protein
MTIRGKKMLPIDSLYARTKRLLDTQPGMGKKMLARLLQAHQRYAWRRLERLRGETHVPRDEPEYVAVPLQPAFPADNRLVSKNCPSTNCSHD